MKKKTATYFYNTLTNRKELFMPIEPGEVKMYTCGPTVYSYAHIGNFRTFIFEDLLRRYLKLKGYKVTQVMNITDVDDKTIRNSLAEGVSLSEYTARYEKAFFADMDALRIERAEFYPKATEHIEEMIELIEKLKKRGLTYEKDGSTYFRISSWEKYGRLSNVDIENVRSGSRYDSDEYEKEDVRDFVLWKKTDADNGEPTWDSPFGPGRPGWHIECSAMSSKYLGQTFDIHTGGVDNIFPHHENEIAQSEAGNGKKFVNYWMHAEHLKVENRKMSKSEGNFYTLRDLSERNPLAVRYLLMSSHYRAKLNFTEDGLIQAESVVKKYNDFLRRLRSAHISDNKDAGVSDSVRKQHEEFILALDDDLNISRALGSLFIAIREVNSAMNSEGGIDRELFEAMQSFLADVDSIIDIEEKKEEKKDTDEIERLVRERDKMRKARDFAAADRIRDRLAEMGVVIEDGKEGSTWYVD
ncbi:MAG: cysteine--tRNA ligase [Candidatus Muiribacteriaceae bacterium]